ncbi:MAG: tyrosine-type recombinase/integrase [Deltaproteobacteria bacterium]|nr:tyrosine-type recombinase/integrase [Deltaproteobacteria bacterium]
MSRSASLVSLVEDHFSWRRKLGFKLRGERDEVLRFARYVDNSRCREVTLKTVVDWARATPQGSARYAAQRYEAVRRVLACIAAKRPGTPFLPPGYLGPQHRRRSPYVYSDAEVDSLMNAALTLGPNKGLRPHTYETLCGLLDAVGLRIGEALALDDRDVDLEAGTLLVREDKAGRSRLLPLCNSTVHALREYRRRRTLRHPVPRASAFLLTETRASRLDYGLVNRTFRQLRGSVLWERPTPRPRLHDLRHTFAVRVLLAWMRSGKDVDAEMPALSAYMGHTSPGSTYWYLTAVPELHYLVAGNMERLVDIRPHSPVL